MKPYFTRLVKAGNRLREFNFRKFSDPVNLIHVDVSDERGTRHIFKMQRSDKDKWEIDDKNLPGWIYEAEEKLSQAIQNE
jgi:hypothetical protein